VNAYVPPLADIAFVLHEIAEVGALGSMSAFEHADPEMIDGILEEAGRFILNVIEPLNRVGDRQHSRRNEDGTVTSPDGFSDAYAQWVAGGWGGVPFPVSYGGGGFPWVVAIALQEMAASANLAFSQCPVLTQGAIDMLLSHGDDRQRETYLPRMITGEWTGTMDLTESQAGSDLGAVRSSAIPTGDGRWRITGQKIFISYGEHDMADNILHLVLARVPNAPPGTRGISCFIVPKILLNEDGSLGVQNQVHCRSIEDKLGLRGSPTCVMDFDDAIGEIVGEANKGMQYMFTMINSARLSVGLQGVAVGEASYQRAVTYAMQREQGRPIDAIINPTSTIVDHPDVRRMLLTQKAYIEAARSLIYFVAASIDLAEHHPDEPVRISRAELVELLTPVAKAWSTDLGVEIASLALQVHGGMGFIEETGIAQLYRDARIGPIYEGTNGIQGIDLVTRKVPMRGGEVVAGFLAGIDEMDDKLALGGPQMNSIRERLGEELSTLRSATRFMLDAELADKLAGASPYLRMFGIVTGGWLMARQALAASNRLKGASDQNGFASAKLVTARFYCEQLLPQAGGLLRAVTTGADNLLAFVPT
jgi:alkylation response protein AidB-like acyl-CoA dehydrogenase